MHYIPVRFITLQCIITISLSHRSVSFQDIMYDYIMNYTCNICQRIPSVSRWAQIKIPLAKKDGLEIEMIESGVATPSFLYRVGYMMLQPSISYVRIWDSHDSFSSCWIMLNPQVIDQVIADPGKNHHINDIKPPCAEAKTSQFGGLFPQFPKAVPAGRWFYNIEVKHHRWLTVCHNKDINQYWWMIIHIHWSILIRWISIHWLS